MQLKRASILSLSLMTASAVGIGCAGRTRVYDSTHDDWHAWDSNESHAYREYWVQTGHPYRRYVDLDQNEIRAYWAWRHSHAETR